MRVKEIYFAWLGPKAQVPPYEQKASLKKLKAGIGEKVWGRMVVKLPYFLKVRIKALDLFKYRKYPVSDYEKNIALSHMEYILRNDPEIGDNLFPREDIPEIRSFLENIFNFAHFDHLDIGKIFPGEKSRKFFEADKEFRRSIRFKKGAFEINGFRSGLHSLEYVAMFEHYGQEYIPKSVKEDMRGKLFLDCGSSTGDSSFAFLNLEPSGIYSFEPSHKDFKVLEENIRMNGWDKVHAVNLAVGEKSAKRNGWEQESIDRFMGNKSEALGLIKMDIEGGEMDALRGAKESIKKFSPVLLIAAYHSGPDFYEIPALIKEINPRYSLRFASLSPFAPITEKFIIAFEENQKNA